MLLGEGILLEWRRQKGCTQPQKSLFYHYWLL